MFVTDPNSGMDLWYPDPVSSTPITPIDTTPPPVTGAYDDKGNIIPFPQYNPTQSPTYVPPPSNTGSSSTTSPVTTVSWSGGTGSYGDALIGVQLIDTDAKTSTSTFVPPVSPSWQPDYTNKEAPYAGMPKDYIGQVASSFVPTYENPVPPSLPGIKWKAPTTEQMSELKAQSELSKSGFGNYRDGFYIASAIRAGKENLVRQAGFTDDDIKEAKNKIASSGFSTYIPSASGLVGKGFGVFGGESNKKDEYNPKNFNEFYGKYLSDLGVKENQKKGFFDFGYKSGYVDKDGKPVYGIDSNGKLIYDPKKADKSTVDSSGIGTLGNFKEEARKAYTKEYGKGQMALSDIKGAPRELGLPAISTGLEKGWGKVSGLEWGLTGLGGLFLVGLAKGGKSATSTSTKTEPVSVTTNAKSFTTPQNKFTAKGYVEEKVTGLTDNPLTMRTSGEFSFSPASSSKGGISYGGRVSPKEGITTTVHETGYNPQAKVGEQYSFTGKVNELPIGYKSYNIGSSTFDAQNAPVSYWNPNVSIGSANKGTSYTLGKLAQSPSYSFDVGSGSTLPSFQLSSSPSTINIGTKPSSQLGTTLTNIGAGVAVASIGTIAGTNTNINASQPSANIQTPEESVNVNNKITNSYTTVETEPTVKSSVTNPVTIDEKQDTTVKQDTTIKTVVNQETNNENQQQTDTQPVDKETPIPPVVEKPQPIPDKPNPRVEIVDPKPEEPINRYQPPKEFVPDKSGVNRISLPPFPVPKGGGGGGGGGSAWSTRKLYAKKQQKIPRLVVYMPEVNTSYLLSSSLDRANESRIGTEETTSTIAGTRRVITAAPSANLKAGATENQNLATSYRGSRRLLQHDIGVRV